MNMIQATFHVHVYQALADNLRHGYLSFDLYKDTPRGDQFLFISSASKRWRTFGWMGRNGVTACKTWRSINRRRAHGGKALDKTLG